MDLTMNDVVTTVIQFICLYYITKVFVKGILILMEGKRQAEMAERAMFDEITHRVKIEKIGDIYYWYDQDDDEFLGQGKDTKSIIDVVKSRFPGHIFFLMTEQAIYQIHGPSWELKPLTVQGTQFGS